MFLLFKHHLVFYRFKTHSFIFQITQVIVSIVIKNNLHRLKLGFSQLPV